MFNYSGIKFGYLMGNYDVMVNGRLYEIYRAEIVARLTWHNQYQLFRLYLDALDFVPIYYDIDSNEILAIHLTISDHYKSKFDVLVDKAMYKLINEVR